MVKLNITKMTREQLYEIFEDIEQHRIYCKEQFADRIAALPLDVPGDEEIEIKYSTSLPVLCCLHDIPIRFDAKQGEYLSIMRDNNDLKQRGAKWMRSEILKRNTP